MFSSGFSLTGLTIEALTAQVAGLLNNPFIVGAILAVAALPFAVMITRTLKSLVGEADGVTDNVANDWHHFWESRGMRSPFMSDEEYYGGLDDDVGEDEAE